MNSNKLLALLATLSVCVSHALLADTFSFTNQLAIPDGQPAGISDVVTISSSVPQIGYAVIGLNIAGDFNGDLYGYVQHDGALAVLLNRTGRSTNNLYGYDDSGFNVYFMDSATNGNIHMYQTVSLPGVGLPLTGTWQPDGRNNSPAVVLDTDPAIAGLGVFNNLDANGTWTLFLSDLSPGGTSQLLGWQLNFYPVPEPSVVALISAGLVVLTGAVHRRKR